VSPSLTLDEMLAMDSRERSKTLKILKTRIHPDKHPNDASVTQIFQNVQNFYDECIDANALSGSSSSRTSGKPKPKRRKKSQSSEVTSSSKYPQVFSVFTEWPIANESISTVVMKNESKKKVDSSIQPSSHPMPPNNTLAKKIVPAYQAYKCIHARGAIAHGRPITKYHSWDEIQQESDEDHSVHDIFDKFGGAKELDSADLIKEELMNRGPVVSVSFRLVGVYLDKLNVGEKAFAKELIGQIHELLIVGWCLTPYGEAWQVQPLIDVMDPKAASSESKDSILHIGFGQFGIDELCLAPESSLEDLSWQPGPYFDSDFTDANNWREWKEMDLPITEKELKSLAKCFKKGLFSDESFVLRDEMKKAHSASYKIKNIRWVEETSEWFVTVNSKKE